MPFLDFDPLPWKYPELHEKKKNHGPCPMHGDECGDPIPGSREAYQKNGQRETGRKPPLQRYHFKTERMLQDHVVMYNRWSGGMDYPNEPGGINYRGGHPGSHPSRGHSSRSAAHSQAPPGSRHSLHPGSRHSGMPPGSRAPPPQRSRMSSHASVATHGAGYQPGGRIPSQGPRSNAFGTGGSRTRGPQMMPPRQSGGSGRQSGRGY